MERGTSLVEATMGERLEEWQEVEEVEEVEEG